VVTTRPHVLAIDAGTTALKAALVVDGAVVDLREEPYDLAHPRPGWSL
jgi:sugar (pentulose or hexulose) kinase